MPLHIVIIGAGPAGESAASTVRRLDKNAAVTLIEKENAGGVCLNKGCIPSKTLLEGIHSRVNSNQFIDWSVIQSSKKQIIEGIRSQLEARLAREGVKLVRGTARFTSPSSLEIQNSATVEPLTFDKAIITTGTDIFYPSPLDRYKSSLLNSDTMLEITRTPRSLVIVGGGAVGCEFACLLNAAGCDVTLVEMTGGLLPGEDAAIVNALTLSYEKRGIKVKTNAVVNELNKIAGGWDISLSDNTAMTAEHVLSCVGRIPSTDSLSLDKAGVELSKKRIVINNFMQTSNPSIFAAGDVAGSRLAHHASAQGEAAAANAVGTKTTCDDRFVPRCLYSWPEVASVGVYKHHLEQEGRPAKTSRAFFKGSSKALAGGDTEGFIQIVSEADTGKIRGAQIIGRQATEIIHIFSVALKMGMTLTDLSQVIFAHPTLSEIIKDAARK